MAQFAGYVLVLGVAISYATTGCLAGGEREFQDRAVLPGLSPCTEATSAILLPRVARESSGLAEASYRVPEGEANPGARLFWTHNDSGNPAELILVDETGALRGQVQVTGAQNVDWEDMAKGPCPAGVGGGETGACLYVADVGDNLERRQDLMLYRVPEPAWGATATEPADGFALQLPVGPRDIEAMALLPDESVLFITKGRNHGVEVLRVDGPLGPAPLEGERLRVSFVNALSERPPSFMGRVTGASASADGQVVAIRTYETLTFHAVGEGGVLTPIKGQTVNLRPLREGQGEAVLLLEGGEVWVSSEAGPMGGSASLHGLRCEGLGSNAYSGDLNPCP